MKLVLLSLSLYVAVKFIYGLWGEYYFCEENNNAMYWAVSYYISDYTMSSVNFGVISLYAITKFQRVALGGASVFFGFMAIVYLTCYYFPEIYTGMITQRQNLTIGQIALFMILIFLNYLRITSHGTKNKRTVG